MSNGTYLQMSSLEKPYGGNTMIIASLSQMKSRPGLTYQQVSDKETIALTSGIMSYKHK